MDMDNDHGERDLEGWIAVKRGCRTERTFPALGSNPEMVKIARGALSEP